MRRLRVTTRILAAVLVALCARGVLAGMNTAIGLTAAMVAALLVVSLILTRQGHRLEPTSRRGGD
jgi:hypothetical protein